MESLRSRAPPKSACGHEPDSEPAAAEQSLVWFDDPPCPATSEVPAALIEGSSKRLRPLFSARRTDRERVRLAPAADYLIGWANALTALGVVRRGSQSARPELPLILRLGGVWAPAAARRLYAGCVVRVRQVVRTLDGDGRPSAWITGHRPHALSKLLETGLPKPCAFATQWAIVHRPAIVQSLGTVVESAPVDIQSRRFGISAVVRDTEYDELVQTCDDHWPAHQTELPPVGTPVILNWISLDNEQYVKFGRHGSSFILPPNLQSSSSCPRNLTHNVINCDLSYNDSAMSLCDSDLPKSPSSPMSQAESQHYEATVSSCYDTELHSVMPKSKTFRKKRSSDRTSDWEAVLDSVASEVEVDGRKTLELARRINGAIMETASRPNMFFLFRASLPKDDATARTSRVASWVAESANAAAGDLHVDIKVSDGLTWHYDPPSPSLYSVEQLASVVACTRKRPFLATRHTDGAHVRLAQPADYLVSWANAMTVVGVALRPEAADVPLVVRLGGFWARAAPQRLHAGCVVRVREVVRALDRRQRPVRWLDARPQRHSAAALLTADGVPNPSAFATQWAIVARPRVVPSLGQVTQVSVSAGHGGRLGISATVKDVEYGDVVCAADDQWPAADDKTPQPGQVVILNWVSLRDTPHVLLKRRFDSALCVLPAYLRHIPNTSQVRSDSHVLGWIDTSFKRRQKSPL